MKPVRLVACTLAVGLGVLPAAARAGITFSPPVGYNTGSNPVDSTVGDVNGDGIPDLVTADNGGGTATALLGKGDGTFTIKGSYPSSAPLMTAPGKVVLGHFLGTGHLDAAVLQIGVPYRLDLLPGAGDGSFGGQASAHPAPSAYTNEIATGRLTSSGQEGIVLGDGQNVDVFLANGNGTFTTEPVLNSPGFSSVAIAMADVNGDGIPDVITADQGLWVWLGKGDGTFQTGHALLTGTIEADHITVGDFNGDGHPDIAYINSTQNKAGILLGDGAGSFTAVSSQQPVPAGTQNLAVGDLDSDGHLDLVTASRSGNVMSILRGNGDGTLAARQDITVSGAWQPVVADFNGDGNPDIAVGSGTLNQMLVYLSNPPTATATPGGLTFPSQTVGTAAATQAVSLQNTSAATLPYLGPPHLTLSGANPSDFSVSGCATSTAPGSSCQLTVGFTPTAAGARSATLTIADNAGTQTVTLQGTATPAPVGTPTTPTGTPTTPQPPAAKPPSLTKVSQAHRRWHLTGRNRRGHPVGTTFKFNLDQAATIKLVFQRGKGRKRYRTVMTIAGHRGANRLKFKGQLGRHKRLPLGSYVLTITAVNRSGQSSSARKLRFTILG